MTNAILNGKPYAGNPHVRFDERTARRLVAVLSLAISFATGEARATDRTWNGGTGGTEAAPLDIYNAGSWNPSGLPTTSDKLIFATTASTVVTNGLADGATKQISGDWLLKSGDWTFLGPAKFPTLENPQNSGDITVVKKGDWTLTYAMYLCRSGNTMTFTNYGDLKHTGANDNRRFQIGNTGDGPCVVENVSGDWQIATFMTIGDACKNTTFKWRSGDLQATRASSALSIGHAIGGNGVVGVVKDAGEWTLQGGLLFNQGSGTFDHNGGTTTVASDKSTKLAGNSGAVSTLKLNGGTFKTKEIVRGNAGGTAVLVFNGGELAANAVSANGLVAAGVSVSAGALGGTINAGNLDVVIVPSIGGEGAMTFKGGGGVTLSAAPTYTGATTVEVGTTLIVPSAIAGNKLAFTIPESLDKGVYDVVRVSEGVFADDVLIDATKPQDAKAQFRLNSAKTTIVCIYGYEPGEVAYIGGSGGSLSVADNWTTGVVPTNGNVTFDFAAATTLIVGDTFRAETITIPVSSSVVTIGEGDLRLSGSLTNACRLAIAQGASLTVGGDLVVGNGQGIFLYSNEGTVTVAGNAVCANTTTTTTTRQFEVVTENTQPILAAGLLYHIVQSGRIFWRLESGSTGAGAWVVGENGLKFTNPENRDSTRFYAQDNPVTLYSSANWTLANTGMSKTTKGDLEVHSNSSLTIDTTDYNDRTTPRTVTLEGRIKADGNVTIAGCGTVVVATTHHNGLADTTVASGKTLAVTDTATLQVNEGKAIKGSGTISLAAGTTLALASTGREFATPDIVPVTLPSEGAATIRIDGTRLRGGEHILCTLASVPENLADHVTVTGAALGSRKYEVTVKDGALVLNIYPDGMKVIIM